MQKKDLILFEYGNNEILKFDYVKTFSYLLNCIAIKYGIINTLKMPKMKQTKIFIQKKCAEMFQIDITMKQFSFLLRPQKGRFPYTAIVIIETMYNLLKMDNDRYNINWKDDLTVYLKKSCTDGEGYEEFALGNIPQNITNRVDLFMETEFCDIVSCFVSSRDCFKDAFIDLTMLEHCSKGFPSRLFTEGDVPQIMYEYQGGRIYFR
jgi:hypothetical protein